MKKLCITLIALVLFSSCEKFEIGKSNYLVKVEITNTPVINPAYGSYYTEVGFVSNNCHDVHENYTQTSYQFSFRDKKRNKIVINGFTPNGVSTHIMLYKDGTLIKESTDVCSNSLTWSNE